MLFALIMGFIASYLYYTIRNEISQHRRKKADERDAEATLISRIMLLSKERFCKMFYAPVLLCNNDPQGITDSEMIEFLRENGTGGHIDIFSLSGMSDGCRNLLEMLNVHYTEHPRDEIISIAKHFDLPELDRVSTGGSRTKRLLSVLLSPVFGKFAVKYGVILLLLSLITPYKIYYIVSASMLILYALLRPFIVRRSMG